MSDLYSPAGHPDFQDVYPEKVYPTGIKIVEQNSHLLFIRHQQFGQDITGKQHQIWQLLTRFGHVDSPGSITVMVVHGDVGTKRCVRVYEYRKWEDHDWSTRDIQAFQHDWFRDHAH